MEINEKRVVIDILKSRFEHNMHRHPAIHWDEVVTKLEDTRLLEIVKKMEDTGGEPDVVLYHGQLYYIDCSKETPKGRVSICYDGEARVRRKNAPPPTSSIELAAKIGVTILDEAFYKALQEIEPFDLKTSSWIKTPSNIRSLGGALFGDRRYNHVFIYHNGADSYYGVRGFRGYIQL